ncbi:hypothetical protein HWV62_15070 [Athelia sp. TMB]|nr:hypothetical protein HWV62_33001 [Athelia sp. TMB]KAF7973471.1 hypothetical protein HWV62_15070 [Athelia sp. TMB]
MSVLAQHPWSWQYIRLKLSATLFRTVGAIQVFLGAKLGPTIPLKGVVVNHTSFPSRDKGRDIIVHIYTPEGFDTSQPRPVLINMHGSGFIVSYHGTDRLFCGHIATHTHCTVLDIDYRKAPEHPFPAALQDVEDVLANVAAHTSQYDVSNIFLSGFSAGGCLALSTAAYLGPDRIKGVVAVYPVTDCSRVYPTPDKPFATGEQIPKWHCEVFYDAYLLPAQARDDPRVSPLFAEPIRFPKYVYIACGDADTFHESSELLARKIQRGRVAGREGEVVFQSVLGEAHAFDKLASPGTESEVQREKMYNAASDMINRALAAGSE